MTSEEDLRSVLRAQAADALDADSVFIAIRETARQRRRRRRQVGQGIGIAVVVSGLAVSVPLLVHREGTTNNASVTPSLTAASTPLPATSVPSAPNSGPDYVQNIAASFLNRYGDNAYDRAATLAAVWHTATVYDAKAIAGQLINDGIEVTFGPDGSVPASVANITTAQKAEKAFFEHHDAAEAKQLAAVWNSDLSTTVVVAGQAILDGHPFDVPN